MPKIVDHTARRRELIEASWEVIAAEGLEGLTMRKVAEAAGCTTGRITHYFADREALILAALRTSNDATSTRVLEALKSDLTGEDKLRQAAEQTLPLDPERLLEWKVWIAFWSAAMTDPALGQENDARHKVWQKALVPLFQELLPDRDAEHEAAALICLINGAGLQAAVNPTRANLIQAKRTISAYISSLSV